MSKQMPGKFSVLIILLVLAWIPNKNKQQKFTTSVGRKLGFGTFL